MRFLLILFFFSSLLSAQNIIKDSTFKKFKDTWWMGVHNEYKVYKYSTKRKIFKTELKHTSGAHYFSFATFVEAQAGSVYKFTIDLKCEGEGLIYLRTVNTVHGLDKNTRAAEIKKRQKQTLLGLNLKLDSFNKDWTRYTCYYTAKENPYSAQNDCFHIMLGSYLGKFEMKNPSIEKVDALPEGTKENIIATSSAK